jgi:hypothetical protein
MLQANSLTVVGLLLVLSAGHQNSAWWLYAWTGLDFIALGAAHFMGSLHFVLKCVGTLNSGYLLSPSLSSILNGGEGGRRPGEEGPRFMESGRFYGKRPDGSLPWWSWLLFLPLHVLTHAVWHLARALFKDDKFNAITSELVVGRRLVAGEHEGGFTNFVDLTAEFRAPAAARATPNYLSFPILDGGVPTIGDLRATLRKLQPGRTYVHCAQGRGRAGLFATAWLLDAGLAATVPDALAILKSARPGIQLNRTQLRCAEDFAAELKALK